MFGEILIGIFGNAIYDSIKEGLRDIFVDKDDDLVARVYDALEEASKSFFTEFDTDFGEPSSSFLARQDNIDVIIKSMFYGNNYDLVCQLSPIGFDGVPDVSNDALLFFVSKLNEAIMKDFRLNKIITEKNHIIESRETSNKILDTLNTMLKRDSDKAGLKEPSFKNWVMKDEYGNEERIVEGKQYNIRFSNGIDITYMFKNELIYIDYLDVNGQRSYYELDTNGNVKKSKFPYNLSEYKVLIPEEQIVNKSATNLSNGLIREKIVLKWDRHADLIYNAKGELQYMDLHGGWEVKHMQRTISPKS